MNLVCLKPLLMKGCVADVLCPCDVRIAETLLASADSRDWVKISEMFLGPAPESWAFTPKHKSNSYGEESQG